jgi:septal ring factor EnvC (AmiA/AmiB activator)
MVSARESMITKKHDLLLDVIASPSKYIENECLKASIKSQGALASYEDEELGITKCSLNAFKSYSKNYLSGGFEGIDTLRLNAKSKLESPQDDLSENTKTIAGAQRKSDRLQRELNKVREQNFLLSIIIKEMKSRMKELAESSESIDKRRAIYQLFDEKLEHELSYSLRNEVPSNEF